MKKIIDLYYSTLTESVEGDPYLSEIAHKFPSHSVLQNSIQLVAHRQILFFKQVLMEYFNKSIENIDVLDWGCGKGHISYLLKKNGYNIISCDIVSKKLDSAFGQDTPIIEQQSINVTPLKHHCILPFNDASFDCVFSFGVLEHVQDDLASLQEIKRVLRKDGVLIVLYLPYALSWTQNLAHLRKIYYHDRLYSIKHTQNLAQLSGFDIVEYKLAQLFPKNSVPLFLDKYLEPLDRFLCKYTPLKYFATNLELVMVKK